MKAIIIEDEAVAARSLEALLNEAAPDIGVEAVLQSVEESVEWFAGNPMPDIVFMDIHLADGSSFSIFDEVGITCPVIFTTAYDEYALRAFEVNSIDYLLKPINRKDMERAVSKFRAIRGADIDTRAVLERLLEDVRRDRQVYKSYFLIADRDKLIPLPVSDIACVYIDAKIVTAVTRDNRKRVLEQSLDEVMAQLDPHAFYRANRQYIVARRAVEDVSVWFGGKLVVNLGIPTPERVFISKARAKEFKEWLTE